MIWIKFRLTSVGTHMNFYENPIYLYVVFIIYNVKVTICTSLHIFLINKEIIEVLFDICVIPFGNDYY